MIAITGRGNRSAFLRGMKLPLELVKLLKRKIEFKLQGSTDFRLQSSFGRRLVTPTACVLMFTCIPADVSTAGSTIGVRSMFLFMALDGTVPGIDCRSAVGWQGCWESLGRPGELA